MIARSAAMDPLTHTLVGASLAATRLGRTTRLAAPALVIGANLPDIDVLSFVAGGDAALGFRRGWTHGVPALVLLPALFAAVLWIWGRWRAGPPGSRLCWRRLTALSYLGVASHPALDWLNTYGMRWWMPFRDTWSYGDSVFIMDPWLWLMLGGGWLLTRRPTRSLAIVFAALTFLLLWVVAARAPRYLPVMGLVAAALVAALVARLPAGSLGLRSLPAVGLATSAAYIAGMIGLQGVTETRVRALVAQDLGRPAEELMVGPMPADPLSWDVLYRDASGRYRFGTFDWRDGELELDPARLVPAGRSRLEEQAGDQIPGFLRWTRFPWIEQSAPAPDGKVYVMDARYARRRTTGFGGAAFEP